MSDPRRDDHRNLLRKNFLFAELTDAELGELVAHARIERHRAGEVIFGKGSPGQSMMAVVRGSVKMAAPSPDGREVVFNIMTAGEIFGEIAVLDSGERSADAIALTDCELLVVYRRDFIPFLRRHPDLCLTVMSVLCRRLRHTSEQVEDVLFADIGARIVKVLLWLANGPQAAPERAGSGTIRVTQQELGNLVGGSRESVNRQLQAWQKAGLLAQQRLNPDPGCRGVAA